MSFGILRLSSEEYYRNADEESQRFKRAMDEFEITVNKKKDKTLHLSQSVHTWDDVLKQLEIASSINKDSKGRWGRMQQRFRKLSSRVETASAWLQILPTQSQYFSVLCGGIQLILGVSPSCFSCSEVS
jgi:hypothetical protein